MFSGGAEVGSVSVTEVLGCLREVSSALSLGDIATAQSIIDRAEDLLGSDTLTAGRAVRSSRVLRPVGGVALTEREATTLRYLPDGSMSQKDIARALGVSRNTVKTHLKSLYQKLGVHGRGEAIHRARDLGLLARRPIAGAAAFDRGAAPDHLLERATA